MSKQEAINTFTEGLNMDLNPLTTPNTILTDCLNGTLLTYNDNEFVLQNDQGNYKLNEGQLNPNYIPIAMKEYANILYIVSYNPIDGKTQIGTYPSPKTKFNFGDSCSENLHPILPFDGESDTYKNLIKTAELTYFLNPTDLNTFFLNPGDKISFVLDEENINDTEKYQTLQAFVLDETRHLNELEIDINDYISIESGDYKPINWKIPGWIALKYRLANIDRFSLNISELKVPTFTTSNNIIKVERLKINVQFEISDKLLYNSDTINNDLRIQYQIGNKDPETSAPGELKSIKFDENLYIYYLDIDLSELISDSEYNPTDTLTITATPVLYVSENKFIEYDQFKQSLDIKLDAQNAQEITLTGYTYYISDDSANINFNMTGPFKTGTETNAEYTIYDYTGNPIINATSIENLNLFGQNICTIAFNSDFTAENIYIFSLKFLNEENQPIRIFNKLLITSKLFNSFKSSEYKDFNDIPANVWIGKFQDYVKIEEEPSITITKGASDSINYPADLSKLFPNEYRYTSGSPLLQNVEFKIAQNQTVNGNVKGKLDFLQDGIWTGITPSGKISYNNDKKSEVIVDVNSDGSISKSFSATFEIFKKYTVPFVKILRNYSTTFVEKEYLKSCMNMASALNLRWIDEGESNELNREQAEDLQESPDTLTRILYQALDKNDEITNDADAAEDFNITIQYLAFQNRDALLSIGENNGIAGLDERSIFNNYTSTDFNWGSKVFKNGQLENDYGKEDGYKSKAFQNLYDVMSASGMPILFAVIKYNGGITGSDLPKIAFERNSTTYEQTGTSNSDLYCFLMRTLKKDVNGISDTQYNKLTVLMLPSDFAIKFGAYNFADDAGSYQVAFWDMLKDLCEHLFVVTSAIKGVYEVQSPDSSNYEIDEHITVELDDINLELSFNEPNNNIFIESVRDVIKDNIESAVETINAELNESSISNLTTNLTFSGDIALPTISTINVNKPNPIYYNHFLNNDDVVTQSGEFERKILDEIEKAQEAVNDLYNQNSTMKAGEIGYDGSTAETEVKNFISLLKIPKLRNGKYSIRDLYLTDDNVAPLHAVGLLLPEDTTPENTKLWAFTTENNGVYTLPPSITQ